MLACHGEKETLFAMHYSHWILIVLCIEEKLMIHCSGIYFTTSLHATGSGVHSWVSCNDLAKVYGV